MAEDDRVSIQSWSTEDPGEGSPPPPEVPQATTVSRTEVGPGPEGIQSTLRSEELLFFRTHYLIPADVGLELPGPLDRVTDPPPGRLPLYEEALKAGLRFPLHAFLVKILRFYPLVPCLLVPNSWKLIMGFLSLCLRCGIRPTASLFRACFTLKHHSSEGQFPWWYLSPRRNRRLIQDIPTSNHGWKSRFFFATSEVPWGFSLAWCTPRASLNKSVGLASADCRSLKLLLSCVVPPLRELTSERALAEVGLSPADPNAAEMPVEPGRLRQAIRKRKRGSGDVVRPNAPRYHRPSRRDVTEDSLPRGETSNPEVVVISPDGAGPSQPTPEVGFGPAHLSSTASLAPARPTSTTSAPPETSALQSPRRPSGDEHPEPRSQSSAMPTSSEGIHIPGISRSDRGLNNPRTAYNLMRGVLLPGDAATIRDHVAEGFSTLLRMTHHLYFYHDALRTQREKVIAAEHRVSVLEKKYSEMEETVAEKDKRVAEAEDFAERARRECDSLLLKADERITSCRRKIKAAAEENNALKSRLEGIEAETEERLRAQEAEVRSKAVSEYLASGEHQAETAEIGADGYFQGVQETRERVQRAFPDADLSFLDEEETPPSSPRNGV